MPCVYSGVCRHLPALLLGRGSLRSLLQLFCCWHLCRQREGAASGQITPLGNESWGIGGYVKPWLRLSSHKYFLWFQMWTNIYGFSYFFSHNKSNQHFDITGFNKNAPRDCLTKSGLSASQVSCFMLLLLFRSFCKQWL